LKAIRPKNSFLWGDICKRSNAIDGPYAATPGELSAPRSIWLTKLIIEEYQCSVMLKIISSILHVISSGVLLASFAIAQSSAPPARPSPASHARPDPNSSAQIGRTHLTRSLNGIATGFTASRAASVASIRSRAEAEERQIMVRKQILSLIGSLPERTPLNARVLGTTQADGFQIEKVLFDSQPNFPVTALL
jgi:hypothetical protein